MRTTALVPRASPPPIVDIAPVNLLTTGSSFNVPEVFNIDKFSLEKKSRVLVVEKEIERLPKLAVEVISDWTKMLLPVLSTYAPTLTPVNAPVPLTGIDNPAVSAPTVATPAVPLAVPWPVVQTPKV
jgi:hypothetical protein